MRKKNLLLLGAAGFSAALGLLGSAASGQTPGPFTQAQVDAGRQAYAANCAACHVADLSGTNDAPQLAGTAFIGAWKGRTTEALYNKINELLAKVDGTIDKLNSGQGTLGQLMVNPQLYETLNGATGELRGLLKDMRANPKKFLRIKLALF